MGGVSACEDAQGKGKEKEKEEEVYKEVEADGAKNVKEEVKVPLWAGVAELWEVEERVGRVRAELLSEVVGVGFLSFLFFSFLFFSFLFVSFLFFSFLSFVIGCGKVLI